MPSPLRTWLIRGLIVAVLTAAALGGWYASVWVSPERVRQTVLDHLHAKFGDAVTVELGEAHVRLFGGLALTDLRLTRVGEAMPMLHAPHAVFFHDKEALNRGELFVHKVELASPTLRIDRSADGSWNLPAIAGEATAADRPIPTLIATDATLVFTDHRPDAPPALAATGVKLTALNDPLPVLKIEAHGTVCLADALGVDGKPKPGVFALPFAIAGKFTRSTGQLSLRFENGEIDFGPDLAVIFAKVHPKAMQLAQQFSGKLTVKGELTTSPDPTQPPRYDVRVEVKDGKYEDPALPHPVDKLNGTIHLRDGKLTIDKMTGRLGHATGELSLESKADLMAPPKVRVEVPGTIGRGPRCTPLRFAHQFVTPSTPPVDFCHPDPLKAVEDRLEKFELRLIKLSLDDDLFASLTPQAVRLREQYRPVGTVDVAVRFSRSDGGWRREVDVRPNGLSIEYEYFKYRIHDLGGSLKKVIASDGTDEFQVKLIGTGGGRRVELTGRVAGEGPEPLIDLRIVGQDIPIDDKLIAALPEPYPHMLGKLRAAARGNFVVTIKQDYQVNRLETVFNVRVYNGAINYTQFPVQFNQVRGDLMVMVAYSDPSRPVRSGTPQAGDTEMEKVELRNFEAVHDGGRMWLTGQNGLIPGTPHHKMTARISGDALPLDDQVKAALKEIKLDGLLKSLSPRGDLTFGADVEVIDRASALGPALPPDRVRPVVALRPPGAIRPVAALIPLDPGFRPSTDLKVTLNFRGPTVTPDFFQYDLHQLSGVLVYQDNKLQLIKCSAKHGTSELKIDSGEVTFSKGGGVYANIGKTTVSPLVPDAAFLKALPKDLRGGLEQMNLRGAIDLQVDHLVVKVPDVTATITPVDSGVVPASAVLPEPKPASFLPFPLPWQKPPPTPAPIVPVVPVDPNAMTMYWSGRLNFAGGSMDAGVPLDNVHGSLSSEGLFEGNRLGTVVGNAWIERANIATLPTHSGQFSYVVRPQKPDPARPGTFAPPAMEVRDLSATLFGGTVGGEARLTFADQPRYRLWLTASNLRLEDVAKHYKLGTGELSGNAQAEALFENVPDKAGKLVSVGNGSFDVPKGRMYNLPVLLELVKVLKGQTPDGVAFEEAHAGFELTGDRMRVTHLDLLGSAISLGGNGEIDLPSKDAKFEFYTIWSQTLKKLLTTPLGDLTGALSSGLFKIELTVRDGKQDIQGHMIPAVTDPVRAVADRFRNRRTPRAESTVRGSSQR